MKKIFDSLYNWGEEFAVESGSINSQPIKLNPFTLVFPKTLENEFLKQYNKNSLLPIKISAIAGVFLFSSFFILDYFLVEQFLTELFLLRVVTSWLLVLSAIFFLEKYKDKNFQQPIVSITVIFLAIIKLSTIVISYSDQNSHFFIGFIFIYFYCYAFLKLRYKWATFTGLTIFVAYLITTSTILKLESQVYWVSLAYLFASNLIGISISYTLEYYSRKNYYHKILLEKTLNANTAMLKKITKSKKAIGEAEQQLLLQSKALESAANGILILNIDGKITWCNQAITPLTGYKKEELIGENPRILKSGVHDNLFYKNIWSTVLRGDVWAGEIINKKKNKDLYYEEMTITPVKENYSNKITNFIAIKQDITSRKQMENDLFENEKRLRSLIENATMGFYQSTPKGEILMANKALIKMLGYNSIEELRKIHLNNSGYVNPKQRELFISKLQENGSIIGFESEWRKKDGSIIHIRESARLDNSSDNVVFEGTVEDITLNKTAENQLIESKERLQIVLDNVYDAIFIHDLNGKVIDVNNKVLDLYNISHEEALNISIKDISSPDMDMQIVANYWSEIINKNKTFKFEWKAMCPHNKYIFDVEVFLSKISYGKKQYILANVKDITDQKEAAKNLIEAKEKAEQSDKFKSEFLAGMSHEIRTPINTILNFVSLIKSDLGENISEDIESSFEMIDSGSRRLIRTIDSIINMSQLQAGVYDINPELFSIGLDILQPLLQEFKQAAESKNLILSVDVIPKNTNIIADSYTITQLFVNLIDNAIKYTNEGSIKITVSENKNSFIIQIEDTGIGISKEFLPGLFEPFLQEEMGYTRSFEGNGLGLALVKKYVDLNKGEIEVESEKGVGSKFIVKLPKPIEEKLSGVKTRNLIDKN